MKGRLERADDGWQLVFERRLRHPPEKVWRAMTEPEHLRAWFPTTIDGDRRAGARLRFVFPNGEGPTIEGEMVTYDPPRHLELRWGDEETLRFELSPDGDGTYLRFVNRIRELGKAARDAAGWHVCLDNLERQLDGQQMLGPEAWKPVHEEYVESFGPEASTIGPPEGSPAA